MDQLSEMAALSDSRAGLYALLARLYRTEVDRNLLDQMAGVDLGVETDEQDLLEGYRLLNSYLSDLGPDPITDLAVDYARVFLGAGIINDRAAYPYESVYTSPEKLIMQDARDQVLMAYRGEGLDKSEDLEIPEDHACLELEFMAHLCRRTQQALLQGDETIAWECLAKQKAFLEQHLLVWMPAFCTDILTYAGTDFYKGTAKVTSGYLHMEHTLLEDLVVEMREAEAVPAA